MQCRDRQFLKECGGGCDDRALGLAAHKVSAMFRVTSIG